MLLVPILGCEKSGTPEQFRNMSSVDLPLYLKHKLMFMDTIKQHIKMRKRPYSFEMDSTNRIVIDTILYSPDKNKAAFFVIMGPVMGGYNAHSYISFCDSVTVKKVRWMSFYSLAQYPTEKEASDQIREIHFREFHLRKRSGLDYNLDDVRFWEDIDVWGDNMP
jgi:hypothetical protein